MHQVNKYIQSTFRIKILLLVQMWAVFAFGQGQGPSTTIISNSPYSALVSSGARPERFENWQWSREREIPGYSAFFSSKGKLLAVFPELKTWNYLSTIDSQIPQRWVDQAFELYFQVPQLRDILCYLYSNFLSFHFYAGVSSDRAMRLMGTCAIDKELLHATHRVQSFSKEYVFLFPAPNSETTNFQNLPVSWTDTENVTFLLVTPQTQFSDLVQSILHEIAIQTDAKAQLVGTSHLQITGVDPNDDEKNLLKLASISSINLTFAAMRAFRLESMLFHSETAGEYRWPDSVTSCKDAFWQIYAKVKSMTSELGEEVQLKSLTSGLYSLVSKNMEDYAREQGLQTNEDVVGFLLNGSIRINDGLISDDEINFCEYMATPHLSKVKYKTLGSHGPRPPVGGGAHGEDVSDSERLQFQNSVVRSFGGR